MDEINKLVGSITDEDFLRGLLLVSADNTFGGVWEKCVTCKHCIFKKQCHIISDTMEEQDKNPTCRDVINLLLGEIKVEDIK